jgi:LacI family transcriptional regulator
MIRAIVSAASAAEGFSVMQSKRADIPRRKREPGEAPRVALLIETSNGYARSILHGVEDYIRSHQPWHIFLAERGRGDAPPEWLHGWDGDGIIARIENKSIAQVLAHARQPVVDLSSYRFLPQLPAVMTDGKAIAELAATHFLNRGFEHFAYCGVPRFPWSRQRGEFFVAALAEKRLACHLYQSAQKSGDDSERETDDIARWLQHLPKPVAVFACYDARGRQILDACHRAHLAVPEEVAVLGVDDDELLCELSPQPLSSIDPNPRRSGWLAAEILDQMMAGKKPMPLIQIVSPTGISTRQSTDVFAIEDANLVKALRFIREHACRGISVDEVARVAGLARRTMEARMKKMLGRSPHEEIMRIQVQRAQRLLLHTNLPVAVIAERAGFDNPEYFSVAFKRVTGVPPGTYRRARGESR